MHNKWCLATKMEACFEGVSLSSLFRCFGKYFLALVRLMMERLKDKCRTLFSSRGCLGCCTKPPLVISVDEPSKGLKIQGQRVKKRSLREDFWSISSGEMDNSAFPSQRSISSISTSNQTLDTHSNAGSTSNPSEFVNHGKNLCLLSYPLKILLSSVLELRKLVLLALDFGHHHSDHL
ncbi:Hypothetical predicted protein [Olea europaea subsp. europaea]|uniref:Uncharacterized protein n=1 Tax=Olea europaea subsp. europaea TaxID=158383 RepID=A0A8S0S9W7_OLEEU|nr:Hypothetical predicted protein [Olea europaea subsp. europaea]